MRLRAASRLAWRPCLHHRRRRRRRQTAASRLQQNRSHLDTGSYDDDDDGPPFGPPAPFRVPRPPGCFAGGGTQAGAGRFAARDVDAAPGPRIANPVTNSTKLADLYYGARRSACQATYYVFPAMCLRRLGGFDHRRVVGHATPLSQAHGDKELLTIATAAGLTRGQRPKGGAFVTRAPAERLASLPIPRLDAAACRDHQPGAQDGSAKGLLRITTGTHTRANISSSQARMRPSSGPVLKSPWLGGSSGGGVLFRASPARIPIVSPGLFTRHPCLCLCLAPPASSRGFVAGAAPILRTSHVRLFVGCACLLVGDGVMSNHAAMAEADRRCTHSRPDKRRLSVSSISTHKRQRQRQRQREPRRLSGRPVRRLCSSIRQCMDRPVMPGPCTDDPRLGWTWARLPLHCYPLPTQGGCLGVGWSATPCASHHRPHHALSSGTDRVPFPVAAWLAPGPAKGERLPACGRMQSPHRAMFAFYSGSRVRSFS
ncbi:hypothetical protein VFPFJ_06788 [Purpureocillium lilacinum]|uniref:Uncharacterized protein n=1 Tax=Purpureocillium lilacinum TaxID=33203 RepID=A0A179HFR2_PURLI|nr:hypothetical protein VFPFJ_06788 [Purpureocillium lilacinum]OAQ88323.1 hypothetical protein VFPFJ_06788 [Purpureocillium lilacinum]